MIILKGEIKIREVTIDDYLKQNGIIINGDRFICDSYINEKSYMKQVKLIVEAQKYLMGCKFDRINVLNSTIGKDIESFKVQIKFLEKDFHGILENRDKNEVDKLIITNGQKMLAKASDSINFIYKFNYLSLIERSMNREEICLGRADEENLRKTEKNIEIGSTKAMSYDLVEEDLYRYIKRLQKKNIDVNEEEMINQFVSSSHLSFSSIQYLKALCNYPRDFLKVWGKYRKNKKNKAISKYYNDLMRSLKYEEKNFIS